MVLHIVNGSPYTNSALERCINAAKPGSTILLIEDGVYAAIKLPEGSDMEALLAAFKFYALDADIKARGLRGKIDPKITQIDYEGFVDLVDEHQSSHSWF